MSTFSQGGAEVKEGDAPNTPYKDGQVTDEYAHRKTQKVLYNIPSNVLRGAKGVAIFTVFRSGLVWSGAGGSGIVLSRDENGDWGCPSGILVHTVGWGLVIGVDVYDVVLVLRTQEAVDAFKRPKVSVGGELSLAAGPVGNGAIVDSGIEASPCLSYVKSKGFYAGAQLDGSIFLTRSDENSRFYNYPDIPIDTILDNKLPKHQIPHTCMPIWQALYQAEDRPDYMGTSAIPTGPSPGSYEATDEDIAALKRNEEAFRASGASTASSAGADSTPGASGPVGGAGNRTAVPPPSNAPILPPPRRVPGASSKAAEARQAKEAEARAEAQNNASSTSGLPPPSYDASQAATYQSGPGTIAAAIKRS